MNSLCDACAGSCCSFKTLNIGYSSLPDLPLSKALDTKTFDDLRRPDTGKLPTKMRLFVKSKPGTDAEIYFDCGHRTSEGKCGIYANRPPLCRSFRCEVLKKEVKLGNFLREFAPQVKAEDLKDITWRVRRRMG